MMVPEVDDKGHRGSTRIPVFSRKQDGDDDKAYKGNDHKYQKPNIQLIHGITCTIKK